MSRLCRERRALMPALGTARRSKIASDLDRPRGFAVVIQADAPLFLADKPVSPLWGAGSALPRRLAGDGITRIGHFAALGEAVPASRRGRTGLYLAPLACGKDDRGIAPYPRARPISAETAFARDCADRESLMQALQPLYERVAARLQGPDMPSRR